MKTQRTQEEEYIYRETPTVGVMAGIMATAMFFPAATVPGLIAGGIVGWIFGKVIISH